MASETAMDRNNINLEKMVLNDRNLTGCGKKDALIFINFFFKKKKKNKQSRPTRAIMGTSGVFIKCPTARWFVRSGGEGG